MSVLLQFVAILLALTPVVVALVNAFTDGVRMPKWVKRAAAIVAGIAVAFVADMMFAYYGPAALPLPVVAVCGVGLGINAAGIYDVSKMLGGVVSLK